VSDVKMIELGSVVRLKSGGPTMTVVWYDTDIEEYHCAYFNEKAGEYIKIDLPGAALDILI